MNRQKYKNLTLTRALLLKMLDYNSETGIFTWKPREVDDPGYTDYFNLKFANKRAGTVKRTQDPPHVSITILHKYYSAHRLAWFYVYGVWPVLSIDHINGNPLDNRIENLREADVFMQNRNQKVSKKSSTGVSGVNFIREKHLNGCKPWRVRVHYKEDSKYKTKHIGYYWTKEEAIAARKQWEKEKGGYSDRHGLPNQFDMKKEIDNLITKRQIKNIDRANDFQ